MISLNTRSKWKSDKLMRDEKVTCKVLEGDEEDYEVI